MLQLNSVARRKYNVNLQDLDTFTKYNTMNTLLLASGRQIKCELKANSSTMHITRKMFLNQHYIEAYTYIEAGRTVGQMIRGTSISRLCHTRRTA